MPPIVPREATRRCRPFTARAWLRLEEVLRLEVALGRSYSPHDRGCQGEVRRDEVRRDEVRKVRLLERVTASCGETAKAHRRQLSTSAAHLVRAPELASVEGWAGD